MTRTPRRAVLATAACASVLLLAGCAGGGEPTPTETVTVSPPASSPPAPAPSATTPAPDDGTEPGGSALCPTSELAGSTAEGGGGAAGSTGIEIVLTNIGEDPCELQGWPGVSFVGGGDGTQLGAAAEQDRGTYPSDTVTLAPGGQAFVPLTIAQALNYSNAECAPREADGLRVYPPGSEESLFISYPQTACSSDVALLTVSAVQATNLTAP
jgi:hypothetical protein